MRGLGEGCISGVSVGFHTRELYTGTEHRWEPASAAGRQKEPRQDNTRRCERGSEHAGPTCFGSCGEHAGPKLGAAFARRAAGAGTGGEVVACDSPVISKIL